MKNENSKVLAHFRVIYIVKRLENTKREEPSLLIYTNKGVEASKMGVWHYPPLNMLSL